MLVESEGEAERRVGLPAHLPHPVHVRPRLQLQTEGPERETTGQVEA